MLQWRLLEDKGPVVVQRAVGEQLLVDGPEVPNRQIAEVDELSVDPREQVDSRGDAEDPEWTVPSK